MPNSNVLRIAKVSSQNRSWPREVVPNQYSAEGGTSGGTTKLSFGGQGEKKDRQANAATSPSSTTPEANWRLARSRATKPTISRPSREDRARDRQDRSAAPRRTRR